MENWIGIGIWIVLGGLVGLLMKVIVPRPEETPGHTPVIVVLGAFAGATGLVNIDSLVDMIRERFPGKLGENNVAAIRDAYTHCGGEECSWE